MKPSLSALERLRGHQLSAAKEELRLAAAAAERAIAAEEAARRFRGEAERQLLEARRGELQRDELNAEDLQALAHFQRAEEIRLQQLSGECERAAALVRVSGEGYAQAHASVAAAHAAHRVVANYNTRARRTADNEQQAAVEEEVADAFRARRI